MSVRGLFVLLVCSPLVAADPASPRLARLKGDLDAGKPGELDAFWAGVAKAGSPLVEPIPGDDRHTHVTFLWRGGDDVKTVNVQIGLGSPAIHQNQLRRLPGTDLWYRTERMRTDARCLYLIGVNDPPEPIERLSEAAWMKRFGTFKRDPLNRRWEFMTAKVTASILELPDAPPQPWVKSRPGTPAGELTPRKVASAILGGDRSVHVYTPPGYAKDGQPYGLLVGFDGPTYGLNVQKAVTLDNLLADGKVPPLVAVFVVQTDRTKELTCNAAYTNFLARELVPWVRKEYHVTDDPKRTTVTGMSYGGLASTYAALKHPGTFGNVLSQSGAFWYRPPGEAEPVWLAREFAAGPKLPVRFYLDTGLMETGGFSENVHLLGSNRHLRDVLRAKGYDVHYREYNGGHESLNWQGTLADGLIALHGKTAPKN